MCVRTAMDVLPRCALYMAFEEGRRRDVKIYIKTTDARLHAQRMPFTVRRRVAVLPLSPRGGGGEEEKGVMVVAERGPERKENAK